MGFVEVSGRVEQTNTAPKLITKIVFAGINCRYFIPLCFPIVIFIPTTHFNLIVENSSQFLHFLLFIFLRFLSNFQSFRKWKFLVFDEVPFSSISEISFEMESRVNDRKKISVEECEKSVSRADQFEVKMLVGDERSINSHFP